ncbi:hypothetical protein F0562_007193 [Nyssa sinensis]|uniref:Uncharacterized protein n=1 Tax=Nyssa sinensis TaxID=561372 RepID=A0A5J5A4T5_9ASTE|nr:hypothetical protein F0562_007193 [Nyssa sinensis]
MACIEFTSSETAAADSGCIVEIETEDSGCIAEIETEDSGCIAEIETEDSGSISEIETQDGAANDIENPECVLVNHIAKELKSLKSPKSLKHCIYRVPIKLRKLHKEDYKPRVVSIGPFHHGRGRLQSMEKHKLYCFKKLIQRGKKRLEDYVGLMQKLEEETRQCYADTIWFNSDKFVQMILVDAGFIIDLLFRFYFRVQGEKIDSEEPLLHKTPIIDIRHDLTLLENQLPFFVLEAFFNLTFAPFPKIFPSLLKIALRFFKGYYRKEMEPNYVVHFTDLIRTLHLPMPNPRAEGEQFISSPSATELHESGVKFKVSEEKCLLDIRFNPRNGVLEIPRFNLQGSTIPYIRNLVALELCHYPGGRYIIDYFVFMDHLINTPKDVDLLVQNGILFNGLGDSAAAAAFYNNLCRHIEFSAPEFYFCRLCKDLRAYHKVPWHKWMVSKLV